VELGAAAACGALLPGSTGGWPLPAAVATGLAASLVLARHAVRRLGGITGDVLGALVEVGTLACLVVVARSDPIGAPGPHPAGREPLGYGRSHRPVARRIWPRALASAR
jgi:adenosylcobinamide-GDP ribazoletransferase